MKCYKGEFVKSRDQNRVEPKLVDCDKHEDMCFSFYSGKTDWIKDCFKRTDILALQSLTGPVQGRIYYTGKILFSLQGTPVLIAGTLYSSQGIMYSLQGIPCENYYTGKSL